MQRGTLSSAGICQGRICGKSGVSERRTSQKLGRDAPQTQVMPPSHGPYVAAFTKFCAANKFLLWSQRLANQLQLLIFILRFQHVSLDIVSQRNKSRMFRRLRYPLQVPQFRCIITTLHSNFERLILFPDATRRRQKATGL
jgi:hypothetical protein